MGTLINFFVKMAQQKKKKWSQTRIKEKVDNQNFIDIKSYERIIKEISKDKLITPSILTTRFRISCSLAKKNFNRFIREASHQKNKIFVKRINFFKGLGFLTNGHRI